MVRRGDRCFECGNHGHHGNVCPNKGKGLKCYKCNKFGHKANVCSQKNFPNGGKIYYNSRYDKLNNYNKIGGSGFSKGNQFLKRKLYDEKNDENSNPINKSRVTSAKKA